MIATTPSASGVTSHVRTDLSGVPQPPLSEQEISKRIGSIGALEIDLIGTKIANNVLNNLGPVGVVRVMQQVMPQKKEPKRGGLAMMMHARASARREVESGKTQFLSDEETTSFINVALPLIKEKLADSFATPLFFLEDGKGFDVSDYEPTGFLAETAEKTGINITLNHVPPKYFIYLKLDEELTREASDLVFVLTQESQGVEFSKETFTLSELRTET